jgi:response regulator RpfG family c-di-GMP phosphodiesterase
MDERILFVDDEPQVLSAFERNLRRQFTVVTAGGGQQGIDAIRAHGPFAVVLSDMRMPGMTGLEFLRTVREMSPDTVRLMLTGDGDLQTAVRAVNEGSVFRFLTKPCGDDELVPILRTSVEQYRLVTAERTLLERTINGLAQALMEVLGVVNPVAHDRGYRARRYAAHIATAIGLETLWQVELAALLSQIGCVTIAPDLLQSLYSGQSLGAQDLEHVKAHPGVAHDLLVRIPRLEDVAVIVARQGEQGFDSRDERESAHARDRVVLGAQILRTALDFDKFVSGGMAPDVARAVMTRKDRDYDPGLVATLQSFRAPELVFEVRRIKVAQLNVGMVFEEPLTNRSGVLLVPKGNKVTLPMLFRLRTAQGPGMLPDDILVRAPRHDLPTRGAKAESAKPAEH